MHRLEVVDRVCNRKDVELVVHRKAMLVPPERQDEPLIEPRDNVLVGFGTETVVDVHRHRVELTEGLHCFEEHDDAAAALDSLDRPGKNIGRDGLKVLQHAHAVRVAENLLRFLRQESRLQASKNKNKHRRAAKCCRCECGFRREKVTL